MRAAFVDRHEVLSVRVHMHACMHLPEPDMYADHLCMNPRMRVLHPHISCRPNFRLEVRCVCAGQSRKSSSSADDFGMGSRCKRARPSEDK